MTHKEFFVWLEGYLQGAGNGNKFVDPRPIVEKMSNVKGVDPFFPEERKISQHPFKPINIPTPKNPFDITCKTNLDD